MTKRTGHNSGPEEKVNTLYHKSSHVKRALREVKRTARRVGYTKADNQKAMSSRVKSQDTKQTNIKPESQIARAPHFRTRTSSSALRSDSVYSESSDMLLDHFLDEIHKQLGEHLKQVILFGSRARGDYTTGSDYDILVIVDKTSSEIKETVDNVAGEFLFQYDAVFSIFPISEEKYQENTYEPLLRNIRKEGINLEPK